MGADGIIVIVVVLFLVFGGALKRLLQRVAQQMEEDQASPPDFEASPEQVKEFLSSLESDGQPQVQADVQAAAVGPERKPPTPDLWSLAKPTETALAPVLGTPVGPPVPPQRTAVSPFWGGAETVAVAPQPREKPVPPPPPRRKRTEAPRRIRAAEAGPVKPPREARKAAAVTPLALHGFGLKQAVVWSEILGRPVSRRRMGRRPPAGRT